MNLNDLVVAFVIHDLASNAFIRTDIVSQIQCAYGIVEIVLVTIAIRHLLPGD